jgi:hypothetical protein
MNIFRSKTQQPPNPEFDDALAIAQAEYLRGSLYVATVGTTAVVLVLTYFFWGSDLASELTIWCVFGMFATAGRLALMFSSREPLYFKSNPIVARKFYMSTR